MALPKTMETVQCDAKRRNPLRQYNEFSGLWRAMTFSKPFYRDVAGNWRGIGARYLLLLVMLTWLLVLGNATYSFSVFLSTEAPVLLQTFPTIKIVNGVASSDVAQPYMLWNNQAPLFIFDTQWEPKEHTRLQAPMVMTATDLYENDGRGNIRRYTLKNLPIANSTISKSWLLSWGSTIRNYMLPVGMVLLGGVAYVFRLLLALIFAALGLLIIRSRETGISFKVCLRLAVVSMTGPIFLSTMLELSGYGMSLLMWGVTLVLTLVYMMHALITLAEDGTAPA
jgi:hypothetical protein